MLYDRQRNTQIRSRTRYTIIGQDKGVGIPNDTIQFETRIAKIWTKENECSHERIDPAARNGYLDSNRSDKAHKIKRMRVLSSLLFLKEKQNWDDKGTSLHQWGTTMHLYPKGGCSVANGNNSVNLHYSINRG